LLALGIIASLVFGFKTGLDFPGGTLMEFKFVNKEKVVTTETLRTALTEIGTELNKAVPTATKTTTVYPAADKTTQSTELSTTEEKLDLENAQIMASGEDGFIVKTKYISNETHDKIVTELKTKLDKNMEELRFTTIGAVVGGSMQSHLGSRCNMFDDHALSRIHIQKNSKTRQSMEIRYSRSYRAYARYLDYNRNICNHRSFHKF
jgi:preprotein translocase subunit SecF